MRFASFLLVASWIALLASCSSTPGPSTKIKSKSRKNQPHVLTGVTEYYHGQSKPSSPGPVPPLPPAPVKSRAWARVTAPATISTHATSPRTASIRTTSPRATSPRTTSIRATSPRATSSGITSSGTTSPRGPRVRLLSLIHASSPAPTNASSTRGPTFANPDGTTSRVIGNALVRSDGTSATMIGNTVFHSNGTTSKIVGDTLINADGSQSSRINVNP